MKLATTLIAVALTLAAGMGLANERAINTTVTVTAPIAEVWNAWATQQGVKTFFAPDAVVEPKVGGLYEMHMNPYAAPGEKGADGMRILALQSPIMLSFTWNAPPHLPEARKQRTFVVVRLAANGERETIVNLHHTGWGSGGEWDKAYDYFAKAWPSVLANLKKRFDEGPRDWSAWLTQLKAAQEKADREANERRAKP